MPKVYKRFKCPTCKEEVRVRQDFINDEFVAWCTGGGSHKGVQMTEVTNDRTEASS